MLLFCILSQCGIEVGESLIDALLIEIFGSLFVRDTSGLAGDGFYTAEGCPGQGIEGLVSRESVIGDAKVKVSASRELRSVFNEPPWYESR
jgi:hypothetical protein